MKHDEEHRYKQKIKADVFARDGGICYYCGRNLSLAYCLNGLEFSDSATVDHLLEKSKYTQTLFAAVATAIECGINLK